MKEPNRSEFVITVLQAHKELIMDAWGKWDPSKSKEEPVNSAVNFRDYLLNYIDSLINETK